MKNLIWVTLFAMLSVSSSIGYATAPDAEWQTLYTKHFEIIYDKPQKELARHYAFASEQSYATLSKIFSDLPSKIVVVLDDSTDLTNGSATFLPYNWINIYPSLPSVGDSLDHYGYWPTAIMIHELTHIANFQPINGFYTPLYYLFGRIVAPNMLLPRWYLEGLAVDVESRYTSHGRLRAPRSQGMIRALSQDGRLFTYSVDQINEVRIPTWPFGERPYFFGGLLQKSLVDAGSADLRERWNQRYGRRVPFFINAVPKDDFGKGFSELLRSEYKSLDEKALKQIEQIEADGSFEAKAFQKVEHEQHSPTLSPDQKKLIYISRSDQRTGVWLIERPDKSSSFKDLKPKLLLYTASPTKLTWKASSTGFYFDELDLDRPFRSYRRVYFYDLEAENKRPVTPSDLRIQDPEVNSSKDQLVGIETLKDGRQSLTTYSMNEESKESLYVAPQLERLSSPSYWGQGHILFAKKNLKGRTDLLLYNLTNKDLKRIPIPFNDFHSPRVIGNQVYLISSESGVDNLYVFSRDFSKHQTLTNSKSLIHSFAPLFDGNLITSQMTSQGRKLFESSGNLNFQLSKTEPLVKYERAEVESLPSEAQLQSVVEDEGSFYPFKYLLPTYWLPFIYPIEGGVIVQGSTAGTDPVAVNQYFLNGSYDTATDGSSYGLAYLNNSFPVSLGLSASKFQEYLGASGATIEKTNLSGQLSSPLGFLSRRWNSSVGYSKTSSERASGSLHREGPQASLEFSNLEDRRYSQNGSLLAASFDRFLPGSDRIEYDRTRFSLGQKVSAWLPDDHSLWIGLKGSFSNELPLNQVLTYGDRSLGANYLVNLTESTFLYRGYPSGTLLGRQLLNSNLEYRFPLKEVQKGDDTRAYFIKTLSGVIFMDALAVDGYYYDLKEDGPTAFYRRTSINETHLSTGGELRLDTTLAYHLPITFIFGGYYGFSRQIGDNFTIFLGIGGLDPLSETGHRGSH
ncbi:hypothetical protein GW916_01865 [bacterium]|nr:hypothetical protein [bacterium]